MSPIIDKLKQYPVAVIGAVVLILCLLIDGSCAFEKDI